MNKFGWLNANSIAHKFRFSYLIFTVLLCGGFICVFNIAEKEVERHLVKSRLLQQFQINLEKYGDAAITNVNSGISIYQFQSAPGDLQAKATDEIQETHIITNHQTSEMLFFKYGYQGEDYILSYVESDQLNASEYPVLTIFEGLEAIFYQALCGVLGISVLIALIFSYWSSKSVIKPILDLKNAVESDHKILSSLPNLPSELEILATTIDHNNQQLADYLLREQLFTGDVSHELRTPLTIIMGATDVLEAQLETDSKLLEFTNRINSTAKDASEIISALLLLSRTPQMLDAPLTSINAIVTAQVNRLRYLIRTKLVVCNIISDKEYMTNVRPELLRMAVSNLIKNAFQYTEEGEILIHIDEQQITIKDSGLSIPENMLPIIYERFGRVEGQDNKVEGTGLGLSIVQRVMSHLGWTLTYQANELGGSTFSIIYHKVD